LKNASKISCAFRIIFALLALTSMAPAQPEVSVYDIQHTTDPSGSSPYVDQAVQVGAIVTATDYLAASHYFIADRNGGLWSGVFVFDLVNRAVAIGDSVHFACVVREASGQTRLETISNFSYAPAVAEVPPVIATTGAFDTSETYEGCLVRFDNVTVTQGLSGVWKVDDGSGEAVVDDHWVYSVPSLGDTLQILQGIGVFAVGEYRLEPRGNSDIVYGFNQPPQISQVSSTPSQPTHLDTVQVQARVTDDSGVESVELYHSLNGGAYSSQPMNPIGIIWRALIYPQSVGTVVRYFVRAQDDSGAVAYSDTFSYNVLQGEEVIPIRDIQENTPQYEGQTVTVEGVVTVPVNTIQTGLTNAYIQDNSGRGINIFNFDPISELARGNLVQVRGTVTEFQGTTELTDPVVTLLATGQPLPAPLELTLDQASNLGLEGTWVKVAGVMDEDPYFAGGGYNLNIHDPFGTITVRVWQSTSISVADYFQGDTLTAAGVCEPYAGALQVVPPTPEDLRHGGPFLERHNGTGTADAQPYTVEPAEQLNITITVHGDGENTLAELLLRIPSDWTWSGNLNDVELSGLGMSVATVSLEQSRLRILDAAITDHSEGNIIIAGMTAPSVDTVSVFALETAVAGGYLIEISNSPAVVVGAGGADITPIPTIRENVSTYMDSSISVIGVITLVQQYRTTSGDTITEAYINNADGVGITLNEFASLAQLGGKVARGRLLRVDGVLGEYQGALQISGFDAQSIIAIRNNHPIPAPDTVRTGDITAQLQLLGTADPNYVCSGTWTHLRGTIYRVDPNIGGGTNIYMDDGSGSTVIRVWDYFKVSSVTIGGSQFTLPQLVGKVVGIDGIASAYQTSFQLVAGYSEDFSGEVLEVNPSQSAWIEVSPHPFAPDMGQTLFICWNAPVGAQTILRIFNMRGQLVATLHDDPTGGFRCLDPPWDGRDELRRSLPVGVYIAQVRATVDGKTTTAEAPIVIGTRLR
jgi:DNA/RNA endonuclease YhcR with UshA esterase domain